MTILKNVSLDISYLLAAQQITPKLGSQKLKKKKNVYFLTQFLRINSREGAATQDGSSRGVSGGSCQDICFNCTLSEVWRGQIQLEWEKMERVSCFCYSQGRTQNTVQGHSGVAPRWVPWQGEKELWASGF